MRRNLAILLSLLILVVSLGPATVGAESSGLYTVRERMGVALAKGFMGFADFPNKLSDFAEIESLGFGWYSDWSTNASPEEPGDIAYVQLVSTKRWPPNEAHIETVVSARPGSLWIIGNEPETRGQGEQTPQVYAERYHHLHSLITELDPTATIAIAGVVMPTPLRLEWLDLCLAAYEDTYGERMPIDVWNIHMQILQEKRGSWGCGIPFGLDDDEGRLYTINDNCSVEIFEQLIWEFCVWLETKGERDKPLIISEYGVLMPSSYLPYGDWSVVQFMEGTSDFLLSQTDPNLGYAQDGGRLVQQWLWFSLNFPSYDEGYGDGFNGALYDWHDPSDLTVFGDFYRAYAEEASRPPSMLYLPYFTRDGSWPAPAPTVPAQPTVPAGAGLVAATPEPMTNARQSGILLPSPADYAEYLHSQSR